MAIKSKQLCLVRGFLLVLGLSLATPVMSGEPAGKDVVMPEGMLGWWYFISGLPEAKWGYAKTPEEACSMSAQNHFQSPLYFMTPSSGGKPAYHCGYKHNWINNTSTRQLSWPAKRATPRDGQGFAQNGRRFHNHQLARTKNRGKLNPIRWWYRAAQNCKVRPIFPA